MTVKPKEGDEEEEEEGSSSHDNLNVNSTVVLG